MPGGLTHFDERGASRMVDVGDKPSTHRCAVASAVITMHAGTLKQIVNREISKGDVREVARLAGIMAAKQTPQLIPLCHSLPLSAVSIEFDIVSDSQLRVSARCEVEAKTGVEMEAMVAVSVACLTIYDMCKSIDRGMSIGPIQLEHKSGGKSGTWNRDRSG
jgi:cyclic pyranopterin phosphate synthase